MKHFPEEELSAELKRNIFLPQITQMTRIFVFLNTRLVEDPLTKGK